jgi:hypothetical protein
VLDKEGLYKVSHPNQPDNTRLVTILPDGGASIHYTKSGTVISVHPTKVYVLELMWIEDNLTIEKVEQST